MCPVLDLDPAIEADDSSAGNSLFGGLANLRPKWDALSHGHAPILMHAQDRLLKLEIDTL
jgi:hypothetical protein